MTKEEYLKLASQKFEELKKLEDSENLYDYEKNFDEIWRDLGKQVLNKSLGEGGKDRRKKKDKDDIWNSSSKEIK